MSHIANIKTAVPPSVIRLFLVEATGFALRQSSARNHLFTFHNPFHLCSLARTHGYARFLSTHRYSSKKSTKTNGFCGFLVEATGFEPTKKRINPFKIKTFLKYFAKLPQIFKPHFVLFCIFKEPLVGLFSLTHYIHYTHTASLYLLSTNSNDLYTPAPAPHRLHFYSQDIP